MQHVLYVLYQIHVISDHMHGTIRLYIDDTLYHPVSIKEVAVLHMELKTMMSGYRLQYLFDIIS